MGEYKSSGFVYRDTPNPHLTCAVCRCPFLRPVQVTGCHHTFCRDCLVDVLLSSREQRLEQDSEALFPLLAEVVSASPVPYDEDDITNQPVPTLPARPSSGCRMTDSGKADMDRLLQDLSEERRAVIYDAMAQHVAVCPIDRSRMSGDPPFRRADALICNMVDELTVVCGNVDRGCPWAGPRQTYIESHDCQFRTAIPTARESEERKSGRQVCGMAKFGCRWQGAEEEGHEQTCVYYHLRHFFVRHYVPTLTRLANTCDTLTSDVNQLRRGSPSATTSPRLRVSAVPDASIATPAGASNDSSEVERLRSEVRDLRAALNTLHRHLLPSREASVYGTGQPLVEQRPSTSPVMRAPPHSQPASQHIEGTGAALTQTLYVPAEGMLQEGGGTKGRWSANKL